MNIWTIIGTVIGALIAGLAMILNSVYTSKMARNIEDRKRMIDEKERDIKELESLYENTLHLLDKLIRGLGSMTPDELERFYKITIKLKLIATNTIEEKVEELRVGISEMAHKLPAMPEEFIPKFEEDRDRKQRLNTRSKAKEERKEKAKEFTPNLTSQYEEISNLMKHDLQERRLLSVEDYVKYRKKS